MSSLIYQILDKIKECLEINFFEDKILFEGLSLHIYATVLERVW